MNDHEREALRETLKYEIEMLKFLALLTVAVGGGTISLALGEVTLFRVGLAGLGFLGTVTLAFADWYLHNRIRALIAQLKEDP